MKLTKGLFVKLLCAGFLLGSCDGNENNSSEPQVMTDDDAGSGGGDDDGTPDEVLPNLSGVTGYDQTDEDVVGWDLLFEDEFSASYTANWEAWNSGAFNEELQHYKPSNVATGNGYLFINQKREQSTGLVNPFTTDTRGFNFTSGRIETTEKYSPGTTEGATKLRFSARIYLPAGEGLWPAFWSYDDPWPTKGEIDIMEFRGNDTDTYVTNFFYGTEPDTPLTNSGQTTFNVPAGVNLTAGWHVYELIWGETALDILLDGVIVHTFTEVEWGFIDDMYNKTQNLVLNLAVGGSFFNGQDLEEADIPDESFVAVDWVRIHKQ